MKRLARPVLLLLLFLASGILLRPEAAVAQEVRPRLGFGMNALLSTADGLGIGFRGRASAPVNTDLSVAVDMGFSGFVLEGRENATYVFDPQIGAIITLPYTTSRAPYIIAGIGAYVPLSNQDETTSGPTFHVGAGWVQLLNETTFFYEVNPALIVGEDHVDLAIPFRLGIIF